jgi:hypothetical protein
VPIVRSNLPPPHPSTTRRATVKTRGAASAGRGGECAPRQFRSKVSCMTSRPNAARGGLEPSSRPATRRRALVRRFDQRVRADVGVRTGLHRPGRGRAGLRPRPRQSSHRLPLHAGQYGSLRPLGVRRSRSGRAPGSRAAGRAMAFKLIESAQSRWPAVNAPHLVALVRAGARFEAGKSGRPVPQSRSV